LRGVALFHGVALRGQWWRRRRWLELKPNLPLFLQVMAEAMLERLALLDRQLASLDEALSAAAPAQRPKGLGQLTSVLIEREIVDWRRFRNHRQMASYTGLVPGEHSSGQRRLQGSITKHGNPRLRTLLVECAWRLLLYQPGYKPLQKWGPTLADATASKARRKKLIIALARQWAVDLWRWRTGRVTLADLGLVAA
jgi:transposase